VRVKHFRLAREQEKLMYNPRRWTFMADMNHSGSVTISDVWLWFKWLYFYPGDGFIYVMVSGLPSVANFFEITYGDHGGTLSKISFLFWMIIFVGYCNKD